MIVREKDVIVREGDKVGGEQCGGGKVELRCDKRKKLESERRRRSTMRRSQTPTKCNQDRSVEGGLNEMDTNGTIIVGRVCVS